MEFRKSLLHGVEIKRCRNDYYAYKPHVHQELAIGYILEGSTDLTLSDGFLSYGAGDGVLLPPLLTHRCAPKDLKHWAYVMLFIDPAYYGDLVSFTQAKKLTGEQAQRLCSFIEYLLAEEMPDALENTIIELLLEFGDVATAELPEKTSKDIAKTIHEYILQHMHEAVTLDALQQLIGINKFSLIRHFKKQYVATPAAYHMQCRVAEAKKLLSQGADVMEICAELNFYDQAHFINEFRKMYGVTPAVYSKQIKG